MHEIKSGTNKFYVGENEENPLAEIHYIESGTDKFIVDQTYVSKALRSEGIGEELVRHMVEYTRDQDRSLVAECPFAKKTIESNEELQSVLDSK